MGLRLNSLQLAAFDRHAEERFFRELRRSLADAFETMPSEEQDALFTVCRADCEALAITSEAALDAYFELSFEQRRPLRSISEFVSLNATVSRRFSDPERLVLELRERL